MKYREFKVHDIPCLEFLMESESILYVGPRLSWWQYRRLKKIQSDFDIIYLYDILDGISKEQLRYNFPGIQFPADFSAETIYRTIRDSIEAETDVKINPDNKFFIRYNGAEFVVLEGTKRLGYAISYLKECAQDFVYVELHRCVDLCEECPLESDPREVYELEEEYEYDFPIDIEEEKGDLLPIPLLEEPLAPQEESPREETQEDCDIRFRVSPSKPELPMGQFESQTKPVLGSFDVPRPYADKSHIEPTIDPSPEDVKKSIDRLIMTGFPIEIIKSWLEERVRLSRLRITRQFKIILVDYDKEIKMGPLPKTVFLFYLRHPEGVAFTHLQDHAKELRHIYGYLSKNDDPEKMRKSIDSLINPLNNSISEKCTAVKDAFLQKVNEDVAKHYYIRGVQGGKKGIALNRSLVEWECKL